MESKASKPADIYQLIAWYDANRKMVGTVFVALLVLAFICWFVLWQKNQREVKASEALSSILVSEMTGPGARQDAPEPYLKVASEYPKSAAAPRAMLLAATSMFTNTRYDDARLEFERFVHQHGDSPLVGQALLGIAACLDVQSKTNEAVTAYRTLVERHSTDSAVPQAKFALARIYEGQNKIDQARALFEDVARISYTSLGSEAGMRLEELNQKHPPATPGSSPYVEIHGATPNATTGATPPKVTLSPPGPATGTTIIRPVTTNAAIKPPVAPTGTNAATNTAPFKFEKR